MPTPRVQENLLGTPEVMPTAQMTIDLCTAVYPLTLEFFADGTYAGQVGKVWNGGEYEVLDNGRVKLSTTKEGISVYDFSVSGDTLVIHAEDFPICELHYARAR
jgi:hypothetical protein